MSDWTKPSGKTLRRLDRLIARRLYGFRTKKDEDGGSWEMIEGEWEPCAHYVTDLVETLALPHAFVKLGGRIEVRYSVGKVTAVCHGDGKKLTEGYLVFADGRTFGEAVARAIVRALKPKRPLGFTKPAPLREWPERTFTLAADEKPKLKKPGLQRPRL